VTDTSGLLDDVEHRERVDPSGFHRLLEQLSQQARDAWHLGLDADLGGLSAAPQRVLLVGLGGSAIGADVAATLASELSPTAVQVVRNYHMPPLTSGTLVILLSFSGNTEEPLTAFETVAASDARGMVITTGGMLGERARAAGMPLLTYEWAGPPHTGLGFGVFNLLAIFQRLGILTLSDDDVDRAISAVDRGTVAYGLAAEANDAKAIATWLHGGVPAIIGADMLEVAARRWAGEMSENAKQVAAAYGIPEFNHNQLEAAARADGDAGSLRFVILDAPAVHRRNRLRVTQTAEMLAAGGRMVRVADAGGETSIEAILAACTLGSWTSYYLSLLRGVDPAALTMMDRLKRALARER